MALDQSQIATWLKTMRGKASRSRVARGSGIPEKSIQRYEIEGVSPPAETFLALVLYYRAEHLLLELLASLPGNSRDAKAMSPDLLKPESNSRKRRRKKA